MSERHIIESPVIPPMEAIESLFVAAMVEEYERPIWTFNKLVYIAIRARRNGGAA